MTEQKQNTINQISCCKKWADIISDKLSEESLAKKN